MIKRSPSTWTHNRWQWTYHFQSRVWVWQKYWFQNDQAEGDNNGQRKSKRKKR